MTRGKWPDFYELVKRLGVEASDYIADGKKLAEPNAAMTRIKRHDYPILVEVLGLDPEAYYSIDPEVDRPIVGPVDEMLYHNYVAREDAKRKNKGKKAKSQ